MNFLKFIWFINHFIYLFIYFYSDDEDESPLNGADESYEIPLYKNIDFNRSQQSDSLLDTNPKKASDNSIQLSSPKVAASIKSDALNRYIKIHTRIFIFSFFNLPNYYYDKYYNNYNFFFFKKNNN